MPGLSDQTQARFLQQSADALSQEADKHLESEYRFGKVIPRINRKIREPYATEDTDADKPQGVGLHLAH